MTRFTRMRAAIIAGVAGAMAVGVMTLANPASATESGDGPAAVSERNFKRSDLRTQPPKGQGCDEDECKQWCDDDQRGDKPSRGKEPAVLEGDLRELAIIAGDDKNDGPKGGGKGDKPEHKCLEKPTVKVDTDDCCKTGVIIRIHNPNSKWIPVKITIQPKGGEAHSKTEWAKPGRSQVEIKLPDGKYRVTVDSKDCELADKWIKVECEETPTTPPTTLPTTPPTTPPTVEPTTEPTPDATTTTPAGGTGGGNNTGGGGPELALTGANASTVGIGGVAAVLAGAALFFFARRRRTTFAPE